MNLRMYDGKLVSLQTTDNEIFEGLAYFETSEYCLNEYGINYNAIRIDEFIFYEYQIALIELIEPKENYLFKSRPLHQMRLDRIPFEMMENGTKTIELRLNDEKRQKIKIGDVICFTNNSDEQETVHMSVKNIYHFDNFEDLYKNLPLLKCGYTSENIHSASAEDMNIYYSKEKQSEYGVLGIEIEELE